MVLGRKRVQAAFLDSTHAFPHAETSAGSPHMSVAHNQNEVRWRTEGGGAPGRGTSAALATLAASWQYATAISTRAKNRIQRVQTAVAWEALSAQSFSDNSVATWWCVLRSGRCDLLASVVNGSAGR